MPSPRPTLTKLRLDIAQDIASSGLPGADGFLRRAALPILGKIQAGQSHEHYGYLDYIAQQSTPFTASGEYLEAWAALAPTPVLRQAPVAASETRATAGTGDQLAVANALYSLQPVTALVYAAAPTPQTQAFTLTGLTSATTVQKAQVSAALTQLLVQMGNPLGTVGIEQSDVDAAISAIPGLPTFAVTSPSSWPITPAVGSLLTLGTVAYA